MSDERSAHDLPALARLAAENRAKTAERRAANSGYRAVLAESRAQDAERELKRALVSLDQKTQDANQAEFIAAQRQKQLEEMEDSLSWRVTRPLRALKHRLAGLRAAVFPPSPPAPAAAASTPPTPEIALPIAEQAPPPAHDIAVAAESFVAPDTGGSAWPAANPGPHERSVLIVGMGLNQPRNGMLTMDLARLLAERYNVTVWLMGGGSSTHDALPEGVEVIAEAASYAEAPQIVKHLTRWRRFAFAVMNGIETRPVLPALAAAYVPVVSLIHDTAAYTLSPYTCQEVMYWSNHTVFACRATMAHAHAWWPYLLQRTTSHRPLPVFNEAHEPPHDSTQTRPFPRQLYAGTDAGTKIVAGIGPVRYQHGVDLFVETAARLLSDPPRESEIQFVWICPSCEPSDAAYAAEIAEQIRKMNGGAHITIASDSPDLATVIAGIDALLFTARSDVALDVPIEALRAGLPLVCFDEATDLADFLKRNELGEALVAPYLDSGSMAQKLKALLFGETPLNAATERASRAAKQGFLAQDYARALESAGLDAERENAQERIDADTLLQTQAYVGEYLDPFYDAEDAATSVRRYLRGWKTGLGQRKPRPGFHPAIYRKEQLNDESLVDPFAHYLRSGSPQGPWACTVIRAGQDTGPATPTPRSALHIHAYYPELLGDILRRLARNRLRPDLFISVKNSQDREAVLAGSGSYNGSIAAIEIVPNTGRDISPLLTAFGERLCAEYELVGHVHTKQSLHVTDRAAVEQWRHFLLENMLGGETGGAMADTIVNAMACDPRLAIVFPDDPAPWGWDNNLPTATALARRMGVERLPEHFNFPAGTMFWMRAGSLLPFVQLGLDWDSYPCEPLDTNGTLLHALERLFGAAPTARGERSAVAWVPGVSR